MLTFDIVQKHFLKHYPDEYEVIGPGEIDHILKGGINALSEDAQRTEFWDTLTKAAVIVTLLQGAYFVVNETTVAMRGNEAAPLKSDVDTVKSNANCHTTIRVHVIGELKSKLNIEIEISDPILSDRAIDSALDTIGEVCR
ncbi:hypothetical protein W911_06030 [Hyphomicrobium nitrativorans NL23]|uniref:Uncharacterized protein n=1 Tax=Hyphomicrobium nitrativorans NL23 TaxID=1029756 RepID=V5SIV6_9HYPH|nr:hypothetical protein [Hyphomicrobium nitrativorans]AHB50015.1 hypothetical protein W911_06030 [Hyphomicrobium nitrativorans NL23]